MKTRKALPGFTLIELLMVVAIISILAAMAVTALAGAAEEGKRARAVSQIEKIDSLISRKWNEYRYRQVPIRIPATVLPRDAARARLEALRELMKYELPDRMTDITDQTLRLANVPSVTLAYRRMIPVGPGNSALEQSECLYLILSQIRDGEDSAIQYFLPSEIGDTDADGLNEILDPWGTPIMFLRWAPGYSRYLRDDPELAGPPPLSTAYLVHASATSQTPNGAISPDSLDPLKSDPRTSPITPWSNPQALCLPFNLKPLIASAGPDKLFDIFATLPSGLSYRNTPVTPHDPYAIIDISSGAYVSAVDQPTTPNWIWIGMPCSINGLQQSSPQILPPIWASDNITNHAIALPGE